MGTDTEEIAVMYVLDTNTLIYFFKGKGRIADHLFLMPPKDIAIPSINPTVLKYRDLYLNLSIAPISKL